MTTAQRDALTATEGETIFNSTTKKINIFTNSAWGEVSGGAASSSGINFFSAGDFESGVTGWSGSGSFTATTTNPFNGVQSANWAITGTGTQVTTLDTTKLSGTDLEASIFTNSSDTNLYFCVVVNSVESCARNANNSGWHQLKVYFNANASTIIKLKYLGASLSGKFDEVKIAPMSLSSVQTVEQESVSYTGYSGKSGNNITFSTKDTTRSDNSTLISVDNSAGTK